MTKTLQQQTKAIIEHLGDAITHARDGFTTFEEMLDQVQRLVEEGRLVLASGVSDNDN